MHHRAGRVLATAAVAAATAATAAVATSPAANAATAPSPKTSTRMAPAYGGYPLHVRTLTTKVLAPLQLAVSRKHGVLVGDAAASKLQQVLRGGNVRTIVSGPQPGEISGVDVNSHGDIAYTSSDYTTGATGLTIRSHGKSKFVNLSAFEHRHNPDGNVWYGTTSTDSCVVGFLKKARGPRALPGHQGLPPLRCRSRPRRLGGRGGGRQRHTLRRQQGPSHQGPGRPASAAAQDHCC